MLVEPVNRSLWIETTPETAYPAIKETLKLMWLSSAPGLPA